MTAIARTQEHEQQFLLPCQARPSKKECSRKSSPYRKQYISRTTSHTFSDYYTQKRKG